MIKLYLEYEEETIETTTPQDILNQINSYNENNGEIDSGDKPKIYKTIFSPIFLYKTPIKDAKEIECEDLLENDLITNQLTLVVLRYAEVIEDKTYNDKWEIFDIFPTRREAKGVAKCLEKLPDIQFMKDGKTCDSIEIITLQLE